MNRRSFIGSILALSSAPAIIRADSLMRIVPREPWFLVGERGPEIMTFEAARKVADEIMWQEGDVITISWLLGPAINGTYRVKAYSHGIVTLA